MSLDLYPPVQRDPFLNPEDSALDDIQRDTNFLTAPATTELSAAGLAVPATEVAEPPTAPIVQLAQSTETSQTPSIMPIASEQSMSPLNIQPQAELAPTGPLLPEVQQSSLPQVPTSFEQSSVGQQAPTTESSAETAASASRLPTEREQQEIASRQSIFFKNVTAVGRVLSARNLAMHADEQVKAKITGEVLS